MPFARFCCTTLAAGLVMVGATGCTGTFRSGSDQPGVAQPAPGAGTERRSIARASEKDIAAALRSNQVDDAEHWAKVVSDNTPYPTDDPSLGKLRAILARDGADPETSQRILEALAP